MKKFFCFFLSLSMITALAACGAAGDKGAAALDTAPTAQVSAAETQTTAEPSETVTDDADESNSKSLVVYFSRSGNTRNVAETIREQTGSDIFEIVPQTPYNSDYNALLDDAKAEQEQNARPEIAEKIENLNEYDTIYIGYPIWWGDMPMILYSFFDVYDLSGKTVALFCTSGGSGLADTVNKVKELEPSAAVTKGLHIGSGALSNPESAVKSWLEEIA